MIDTMLIGTENGSIPMLTKQLAALCPHLSICGIVKSREQLIQVNYDSEPELLIVEKEFVSELEESIFADIYGDVETIIVCPNPEAVRKAYPFNAYHLLSSPIVAKELLDTVQLVRKWILLKRQWRNCRNLLLQLTNQTSPNDLIGIPTMEGVELLSVKEIIRCEGLQQFTKVVVATGEGIISSYNIGKFCKLLDSYGFFATHKSHLINLRYVRRYTREGLLLMRDGSTIPVSRRRRSLFLDQIRHL